MDVRLQDELLHLPLPMQWETGIGVLIDGGSIITASFRSSPVCSTPNLRRHSLCTLVLHVLYSLHVLRH